MGGFISWGYKGLQLLITGIRHLNSTQETKGSQRDRCLQRAPTPVPDALSASQIQLSSHSALRVMMSSLSRPGGWGSSQVSSRLPVSQPCATLYTSRLPLNLVNTPHKFPLLKKHSTKHYTKWQSPFLVNFWDFSNVKATLSLTFDNQRSQFWQNKYRRADLTTRSFASYFC